MTNKQTFPVRLDVEFSDADIDLHIFGSGFATYEWWYYIDDGRDGYDIEAEDPNGEEILSKTVTYDDIRRVMGEIVSGGFRTHFSGPMTAQRQIMDGIRTEDWDIDSDGADEIMQCAMFGKVVFG